jgi:hypothetical protein
MVMCRSLSGTLKLKKITAELCMKKSIVLSLCLMFGFTVLYAENTPSGGTKSAYEEKLKAEASALIEESRSKRIEYQMKMRDIARNCKGTTEIDGQQYTCDEIPLKMHKQEVDLLVEEVLIRKRYEQAINAAAGDVNAVEAVQGKDVSGNLSFFIGPSRNSSSSVGTLLGDEDAKTSEKPKNAEK